MINDENGLGEAIKQKSKVYVYLISIIAAVGGFIFGFDMMLMGSAILHLKDYFALGDLAEGLSMISANFGVLPGLLFAGVITDALGRKRTLLLAALLFAVSALGTAVPKTYFVWYLFRFIGGIGGGLAGMVSPMYIAEISPARTRGRLVTINQLAICLSALAASIVGYYLTKFLEPEPAWRWMFASEIAPILILVVGMIFIPRSPRWLVEKGRIDEARRVLASIDGPEHAEKELQEIRESMTQQLGRFVELLKPGMRVALIIAIGLAAFQQLAGVSTMTFYAPTMFKEAGLEKATEAIAQSVIINGWVIVCTVFALWAVDRLGRRPLLLVGTLGMATGQVLMGIRFHFNLAPELALVIMFLSVAAYTTSLAPLAWLIMSEIFPTRLRARGMAIASIVLQLAAMLANALFPIMLRGFTRSVGSAAPTFWIFALVCFVAYVFCFKLVPETKGRTLEEIAQSWTEKRGKN